MASVKPFAALRPRPDLAASICELPYDVMSSEEARRIAEGNPWSFLRVSKPEIELPPGTDVHSAAVYARGRENFLRLIALGAIVQDTRPAFHVYRQIMGGHSQTGLVAVASCREYLEGVIRRHELTRPDKEDDRVRHIEALDAQTGPAFLAFRAVPSINEMLEATTTDPPAVDFVAKDGIRHTSWVAGDAEAMRRVQALFREVPHLYIADGHHRSAAAARVCQARGGRGGSEAFLAVIFPHTQLQILPYHRLLKDLNGHSPTEIVRRLSAVCRMRTSGQPVPQGRHHVGLFLRGTWYNLEFKEELVDRTGAIDQLDVTLLQRHILEPVFGIGDPRTSERIAFVGGVRGTGELERLVGGGEYAGAFSLHPAGMEELMTIADAGEIMPPKSTWFEPKLRDGMFSHVLGEGG